MNKTVKNFSWRTTQPRAIAALSTFIKLAVVRGVHHNEVLEEIIGEYNRAFTEEHGLRSVKLVNESDLLPELQAAGMGISHTTLMKYKRKGLLDNVDGQPQACYTNGLRVVYNLSVVKARIRKLPGGKRQS